MTKTTAAIISAIGHPFFLLPLIFSLLAVKQVGLEKASPALIAVLTCMAALLIYLFFRKRKGLVSNWDVSAHQERSRNVYQPILALVLAASAVLYFFNQPFVGDTLFFGLLMAVCYAINIKIKISQHTSIATYLGFLALPVNLWLGIALLVFVPFIAWSRVVLGRHTRDEVMIGGIIGGLFGLLHIWLF